MEYTEYLLGTLVKLASDYSEPTLSHLIRLAQIEARSLQSKKIAG